MDTAERLYYLLDNYIKNHLTETEQAELKDLVNDPGNEETIKLLMDASWENPNIKWDFTEGQENRIRQEILHHYPFPKKQKRKTSRYVILAAAAITLLIIGPLYFIKQRQMTGKEMEQSQISFNSNDIKPGGNKAILTLENGQVIVLDSARKGKIADQGGIVALKVADGQVTYDTAFTKLGGIVYNTLSTPNGGQYMIELQDKTKVWLNAASSLHFPIAFNGDDRRVDLTGEAYFEVAHNAKKPFYVRVNGTTIKVLGTHFNVQGYTDDENITTSLLEGSVTVGSNKAGVPEEILLPNQQAVTTSNGSIELLKNSDIELAVAWKNGQMAYKNESIYNILKQAARWYDVVIEYRGILKDSYTIDLPRNTSVIEFMKMLESNGGVHFELKGRTIIVKP